MASIFTEIRGLPQEISLVTKKGVEARNYDGVSVFLLFITQFFSPDEFLIFFDE